MITKLIHRRNPTIAQRAPLAGLAIHPYLLGLYPIAFLLAANIQELPVSESFRSAAVVLTITTISLISLRFATRDWHKAAAICSLGIVLFFSYGHLYTSIKTVSVGSILIGRHRYLAPAFTALFLSGSWFVLFRVGVHTRVTGAVNIAAAFLILLPIYRLSVFFYRSHGQWDASGSIPPISANSLKTAEVATRPDIYYIVLDAYARSDVMLAKHGFDNSSFISFLEERGFYVADKSNANHMWTALSLASSLNMAFVQDLGLNLVPDSYPSVFVNSIRKSRVRIRLERLGYSTVAFRTGYTPTEILDADYYFEPEIQDLEAFREPFSLNAFESLLLQTTAGRLLADFGDPSSRNWIGFRTEYPFDVLREIILTQFEKLEDVAELPGPKFVFVHIIAPHSPYLFGPEGEEIAQNEAFTLVESEQSLSSRSKSAKYRDQAVYITSRVQGVVDAILEKSSTPPIIILQADHGPGIGEDWNMPDGEEMWQRTAILNAYHLPNDCDRFLYPSITPVNTFRVILNCYFGGDFKLLEDEVFFSYWPRTVYYSFLPVTDRVR